MTLLHKLFLYLCINLLGCYGTECMSVCIMVHSACQSVFTVCSTCQSVLLYTVHVSLYYGTECMSVCVTVHSTCQSVLWYTVHVSLCLRYAVHVSLCFNSHINIENVNTLFTYFFNHYD